MLEYRGRLADEESVTWLDDMEEFNIAELWQTSLDYTMDGTKTNYDVVKDRCKMLRYEVFDVYKLCRSMTNEFNKKD